MAKDDKNSKYAEAVNETELYITLNKMQYWQYLEGMLDFTSSKNPR